MEEAERPFQHDVTPGERECASSHRKIADVERLPLVLLGAALMAAAALSRSTRPQLPLFLILASVVALLGAARLLALDGKRIVLAMSSRRLLAFLILLFLADVATLGALGPAGAYLLGTFANLALLTALLGAFYLHLRVRVWQPFLAAVVGGAAALALCAWSLAGEAGLSAQRAGGALWAGGSDIAALWSTLARAAGVSGLRLGVLLGLLTYAAVPWAAFVCAGILFVFFVPTRNSMPAGLFCAACLTFALQRMTYLNLWVLENNRLALAGFCELSRPAGFLLVALPQCLFVIAIVSAISARDTAPAANPLDVRAALGTERDRVIFDTLSRRLLADVELAAGGVARHALAREIDAAEGETQTAGAPLASLLEKLSRLRESCAEVLGKQDADEALRTASAALPRELRDSARETLGLLERPDLGGRRA
ncbi:MAG: hypothetical protein V2A58_10930 [Planctomycetota bacterium]